MRSSISVFLLCMASLCLATPVGAAEPLPTDVQLTVGDTQLLAADVTRVAVGNGKLLSVSTPEREQVLLLAEAAGTTTLQLWLRDGHRHRLRVTVNELDLVDRLDQVQRLLDGTTHITARIAGSRIVLEGLRVSEADQSRALQIAESFPGLVLNFIGKVGWESMIQMDVRIVEVRRDQVGDLGLRWSSEPAGPAVGLRLGDVPGTPGATFSFGSQLASRIDLLQRQGLAETLAEPMLSCRSGGVARFVSGGEVPIPVLDGLGSTDVQYKEYGVILEVRPRADASGAIYAEIDAELSQIDDAVRVQNFPGFIKRRSTTAVNVKAGETVVIAGLLSRERGKSQQAVPGLGRLPLAGALFSSRHRLLRQTELLVLITPRLIQGLLPGEADASNAQRQSVERAGQLADAEVP